MEGLRFSAQVALPNVVQGLFRRRRTAVAAATASDVADQFAPERWLTGEADGDSQYNHFSHGPQGCPGVGLSLLVGKAVLGTVLRQREVRFAQPSLDAAKPVPTCSTFSR